MCVCISRWQSIGFTHGVCNTDNFSILSLTIDYGPFGFLDTFKRRYIPNQSDDLGRYSYQNQPEIGMFNLNKLREALLPIIATEQHNTVMTVLLGYRQLYEKYYYDLFRKKLGLAERHEKEEELLELLLDMMEDTEADFTATFTQLSYLIKRLSCDSPIESSQWSLKKLESHEKFKDFCKLYSEIINYETENPVSMDERVKLMTENNPRYVLRNWMAQKAIEDAENDNFDTIRSLLHILEKPFDYQEEAETAGYSGPTPEWANKLKLSCSS